jgi:hypothetical protein
MDELTISDRVMDRTHRFLKTTTLPPADLTSAYTRPETTQTGQIASGTSAPS